MSTLSIARSRPVMPALVASVLMGGLVTGCANGQNAPTRQEYAVTDGVQAHAGNVVLRDLYLSADVGDTAGGVTKLVLEGVVVNNNGADDQLTSVVTVAGTSIIPLTTGAGAASAVASSSASAAASPSASASPAATPSPAAASASPGPASLPATLVPGIPLNLGTGGLGLQVTRLRTPALPGQLLALTFSFQQAGRVTVQVPVYALTSASPEPVVTFPTPDLPQGFNEQEFDNQAAPSS